MDFLKTNCTSTLYLCWGAMAGLHYFHKIQKVPLDSKLFGIFDHYWVEKDLLLNGLDEIVKIPHSRHSGINEAQVRANKNLKILLEGKRSGIAALKDEKDFFILGHPEYSKKTLDLEYKRDLNQGLEITPPSHYYDEANNPLFIWRSSASVLNKYDILCDRIQFDSSYNVTLGYGGVKVTIGALDNLDEKLMQLPQILPSLAGEKGTLDLQNYTADRKSVSFEREK